MFDSLQNHQLFTIVVAIEIIQFISTRDFNNDVVDVIIDWFYLIVSLENLRIDEDVASDEKKNKSEWKKI